MTKGLQPHYAGFYPLPDEFPQPGFVPRQTGDVRTVTTQSKAGLGTQGPIQTHSYPEALPAPKDMDIPD